LATTITLTANGFAKTDLKIKQPFAGIV